MPDDIEGRDIVAARAGALHSNVLVVPHHGSKTSSSAPFLDALQPPIAVFQAGYRSRFGRPAAELLDRYRERGIAIVASPACGAWQWLADASAEGSCEREIARRYWHHRIDAASRSAEFQELARTLLPSRKETR